MVDAGRLRWLAAGETMAVIAVPLGVFAVGSLAVAPLDESSLLAGLVASFAVWLLGAITITDIEAVDGTHRPGRRCLRRAGSDHHSG